MKCGHVPLYSDVITYSIPQEFRCSVVRWYMQSDYYVYLLRKKNLFCYLTLHFLAQFIFHVHAQIAPLSVVFLIKLNKRTEKHVDASLNAEP